MIFPSQIVSSESFMKVCTGEIYLSSQGKKLKSERIKLTIYIIIKLIKFNIIIYDKNIFRFFF